MALINTMNVLPVILNKTGVRSTGNTGVDSGDILASLVGFIQQGSEIQKIFKCHTHILRKILTNTHTSTGQME